MPMHNPMHPGLVLKDGLGDMSITDFAKHLGVTRVTLSRILNGRQGITAEMSIRLGRLLGNAPDFWFRLQNQYDIWQAEHNSKVDYSAIKPLFVQNPQVTYA